MAQLGYTWYPQDWWTSQTFKRLKRYPMVRYALRELFDLMYKEGEPVKMNRDFLLDDFDIDLNDKEYEKLLEYIEIQDDGKWWIESIRKRISKAEAARENGKKGGRPKTQKPSKKTQDENPKNPPYKRERERERETKEGEKNDVDVYENFKNELAKEGISMWAEGIYMQFKLKPKNLGFLIEDFIKHLRCSPENPPPNLNEFKRHFYNWCNRVLPEGKLDKYLKNPPKQPGAL